MSGVVVAIGVLFLGREGSEIAIAIGIATAIEIEAGTGIAGMASTMKY